LAVWLTPSSTVRTSDSEEGKEEPTETAEKMLRTARTAMGELCRFEIECDIRNVDHVWQRDDRRRIHAYYEAPFEGLLESRAVDISNARTSLRGRDGKPYALKTIDPETMIWTETTCIAINEKQCTYDLRQATDRERQGWFGFLSQAECVRSAIIPPWLDSSVEWKELTSRYEIGRARSNSTDFLIELNTKNANRPTSWSPDKWQYAEGRHWLVVDRRTGRLKRWKVQDPTGGREDTFIYTRIDTNPPHSDVLVDLSNYKEQSSSPPRSTRASDAEETSKNKELATGDLLEIAFRAIMWWVF
jgi:hypothetical protein